MEIVESDLFEMDIPLVTLIGYNDTCKINTNSTRHFESYGGILVYVTYPEAEEEFTVQLGVDENGIVYEGDYGCRPEYKEIPMEQGIRILLAHRDFMNSRRDLEMLLVKNRLDNSTVDVKIT